MKTTASTVAGLGLVVLAALAGCSKSDPPAAAEAGAAAAAAPGTATSTSGEAGAASGEAGAAATAAGAAHAGATYTGKYTVTAGTMYVPNEKDWASVKFKNDDTKMLGDGEMTLNVDSSGKVAGTTEAGPLGASIIDGRIDNGLLTATIRRKDVTDDGLTGTLVATVAGDVLAGTMNLAESNAAVVRVAKLEAKKK